jgi:two-component system response regulator DctR
MSPPPTDAVGVHIVDDDAAIRDSLDWLFRSRGLAVDLWDSGDAFLAAWTPATRGCIVLDVRMGGMSGLDVLDRLERLGSVLPVVVLTGHGDVPVAVQSLKKGAIDFLEKPFDGGDLVTRVVAALDLEARRHAAATTTRALEERLATLSPREREVMDKMLDGLLNKQIADDLGIAMRTVEVHRARILEKFGVRSAIELAGRLADLRRNDR